jgi:glycosyltransferase involved in cell wall biosynthesis
VHNICLVITDIFPPVNAVGVHRTVALCRHLADRGWQVTVITARPRPETSLDPALMMGVPSQVRVIRTASPNLVSLAAGLFPLKSHSAGAPQQPGGKPSPDSSQVRRSGFWRLIQWLSFWLHVPGPYTSWFVSAVWAGLRVSLCHRPDVIFSTAPMWSSHLAGAVIARLRRIPWVADFRDPWYGNPWRAVTTDGFPAHRRADAWLERLVVRKASRVTCAWDQIRQTLAARHPERAEGMSTIYNGFDPDQIDPVAPVRLDGSRCVLLHAGLLYGPRSPIPILEGLRSFQVENPAAAGRLLMVFVGPPAYKGRPLADLAREYAVEELVRVVPPVPYLQALAYLKGAEVAVLFGQTGEGVVSPVPAKAYEYIGAGKPVLAIGAGEEAIRVMQRGGCRVWQAGIAAEVPAMLRTIAQEYHAGRLGGRTDDMARNAFTRKHMAQQLEETLVLAIMSRTPHRQRLSAQTQETPRSK